MNKLDTKQIDIAAAHRMRDIMARINRQTRDLYIKPIKQQSDKNHVRNV